MKKEQIVSCYLNALSAMGYSLIAPLFPPLFRERGLSNILCSYLISIICITNIISALSCSSICQKVGQKKLLLLSVSGLSLSMFCYGFGIYISQNNFFVIFEFINRLFHGFFCGLINVICFSITSQINSGKELEKASGYMELSWQIGLTIGPTLIGAIFDYVGYAIPFIIIGFVSLSGVYYTYKYIYLGDLEKYEKEKLSLENIEEVNLIEEKDKGNKSLLTAIKYPPNVYLTLCLIVQLNTIGFYLATLVNYLKDEFDITISKASLFFLLATIGSAACIQIINKLTDYFNNFQLMYYGLYLGAIFTLFIAPIGFLPHSYIMILIGIFSEGFISGIIIIPTFIELSKLGKILFKKNKELQQNVPASLFNLCFYISDLIEPVIGSWITKAFSFQMSAYFSFVLNIIYAIIFRLYFKFEIKGINPNEEDLLINNKLANINPGE